MQTLKPGEWLNDEVINYYYQLLGDRDDDINISPIITFFCLKQLIDDDN